MGMTITPGGSGGTSGTSGTGSGGPTPGASGGFQTIHDSLSSALGMFDTDPLFQPKVMTILQIESAVRVAQQSQKHTQYTQQSFNDNVLGPFIAAAMNSAQGHITASEVQYTALVNAMSLASTNQTNVQNFHNDPSISAYNTAASNASSAASNLQTAIANYNLAVGTGIGIPAATAALFGTAGNNYTDGAVYQYNQAVASYNNAASNLSGVVSNFSSEVTTVNNEAQSVQDQLIALVGQSTYNSITNNTPITPQDQPNPAPNSVSQITPAPTSPPPPSGFNTSFPHYTAVNDNFVTGFQNKGSILGSFLKVFLSFAEHRLFVNIIKNANNYQEIQSLRNLGLPINLPAALAKIITTTTGGAASGGGAVGGIALAGLATGADPLAGKVVIFKAAHVSGSLDQKQQAQNRLWGMYQVLFQKLLPQLSIGAARTAINQLLSPVAGTNPEGVAVAADSLGTTGTNVLNNPAAVSAALGISFAYVLQLLATSPQLETTISTLAAQAQSPTAASTSGNTNVTTTGTVAPTAATTTSATTNANATDGTVTAAGTPTGSAAANTAAGTTTTATTGPATTTEGTDTSIGGTIAIVGPNGTVQRTTLNENLSTATQLNLNVTALATLSTTLGPSNLGSGLLLQSPVAIANGANPDANKLSISDTLSSPVSQGAVYLALQGQGLTPQEEAGVNAVLPGVFSNTNLVTGADVGNAVTLGLQNPTFNISTSRALSLGNLAGAVASSEQQLGPGLDVVVHQNPPSDTDTINSNLTPIVINHNALGILSGPVTSNDANSIFGPLPNETTPRAVLHSAAHHFGVNGANPADAYNRASNLVAGFTPRIQLDPNFLAEQAQARANVVFGKNNPFDVATLVKKLGEDLNTNIANLAVQDKAALVKELQRALKPGTPLSYESVQRLLSPGHLFLTNFGPMFGIHPESAGMDQTIKGERQIQI